MKRTIRQAYVPIAEYGLIGSMHTCALVARDGSIDWACLPAFDSPSTFGRILDSKQGGFYRVAAEAATSIERRYLPHTNILETTFTTLTGVARLTDFMPLHPPSHSRVSVNAASPGVAHHVKHPRSAQISPDVELSGEDLPEPFELRFEEKIIRILECVSGTVDFVVECEPRFDYGSVRPRTVLDRQNPRYGLAHGGANALLVYCSAPLTMDASRFEATGSLTAGEKVFSAVASMPHYTTDFAINEAWIDASVVERSLRRTEDLWRTWASGLKVEGEFAEDLVRSALALRALVYEPSGAIVAAPTTSLPEGLGGERNWDYRFTWIRDASFSLKAFFDLGLVQEANGFKDWLEWTTAYPEDLQLMYGIRGERQLEERILPLEGYWWSPPVRVGNGAAGQFQLDIYGELLDSSYVFRQVSGELPDSEYWALLHDVVEFAAENWGRPDAGIWESRGGDRHFVYSKAQCWTALDRGIKLATEISQVPGREAEVQQVDIVRWSAIRELIRNQIMANGYDESVGAFVQSYGSRTLDASALMLPLIGFIEATDPRMKSTIEAIERDLTSPEGLVYRYKGFDDGLDGDEGTFIICSFWLVENLALLGETAKARSLFEKLRGFSNDLGLFSEEFDTASGEMLGNFPQAFSHLAFINSAVLLQRIEKEQLAAQTAAN